MDNEQSEKMGRSIGGQAADSAMDYLEKSGLSARSQRLVTDAMEIARGLIATLSEAEAYEAMNVWYTLVLRTVKSIQDGVNEEKAKERS